MNDDATSRFIASLVKSLQSLCHGYMDFEKNIEIIGHIYVNIDSHQKFDYIVNEQMCKNADESSTVYVSNSFHAQPSKKSVRTFSQNDVPLDLKTHSAKDVTGVDLSTFQSDTGQGRSASRESSQSLSAGSETGSFSGSVRESSLTSSRQNPEKYVSRRKRHLNEVSVKLSPTVSPPPSRNRDGERRDPHDSPLLRSQYTLGASASKLARRISNELEKQGLANPVSSDSEIHSRLSTSNQSPSRLGHHDNSVSHQRHFSDDSSKDIDSVKDPSAKAEEQQFDDSIDLTRVKEEVTDDHFFDQLDWSRSRETDQETSFPRTGPDDPASEGHNANTDDQLSGEASLYPVMIHQNTAGLPVPGYGSPVFPGSFTEPSHTMSAGSSPIPSTSGQLSPGSAFASRRGQSGNSGRGYNAQFTPRPGKVPQDMASKFNEDEEDDVVIIKDEPSSSPEADTTRFEARKNKISSHSRTQPEERTVVNHPTRNLPRQQPSHTVTSGLADFHPGPDGMQQLSTSRHHHGHNSEPPCSVKTENQKMSVFGFVPRDNVIGSQAGTQRGEQFDDLVPSQRYKSSLSPEGGVVGLFPSSILETGSRLGETIQAPYLPDPLLGLSNQQTKAFRCTVCPFSHSEESFIRSHMATVHVMEAYICSKCLMVFNYEKDLTAHKKYKHGRGFECEQCGKVFTLKCNLVEHVKRIHEHGVNARHFVCPVSECQKTFTRPSHLRIHITRNHIDDPIIQENFNDMF